MNVLRMLENFFQISLGGVFEFAFLLDMVKDVWLLRALFSVVSSNETECSLAAYIFQDWKSPIGSCFLFFSSLAFNASVGSRRGY